MNINTIKNLSLNRYLVRRALNRFLGTELKSKKFNILLDVGSGRSPYRKFINADKYIALDVENRTGAPGVIPTDLNDKIFLDDNYADCVICTEVLEHLKKPRHALKEIHRVLNPGGMLILTTPMVWMHHETPNDFFRYTKFGLEYLLQETGFREFSIKPSNTYGYTLAQLAVANLRGIWWKPVVFCVNILGMLSDALSRNHDLPLGHQVVAYKNK